MTHFGKQPDHNIPKILYNAVKIGKKYPLGNWAHLLVEIYEINIFFAYQPCKIRKPQATVKFCNRF